MRYSSILTARNVLPRARSLSTKYTYMRGVVAGEGGKVTLRDDIPMPKDLPGHTRMRVLAAGLNRADLLQAAGKYSPPPGVTPVLGLECAGILPDGSYACGLVSGGALAEECLVPTGSILEISRDSNSNSSVSRRLPSPISARESRPQFHPRPQRSRVGHRDRSDPARANRSGRANNSERSRRQEARIRRIARRRYRGRPHLVTERTLFRCTRTHRWARRGYCAGLRGRRYVSRKRAFSTRGRQVGVVSHNYTAVER